MRVKAVIMRPDRTNDVVVVKKKHIKGKQFNHGNCTYFLHADRFQVTWKSFMGAKLKYFATYYYVQGVSQPLPVPNFLATDSPVVDENGEVTFDANGKVLIQKVFPKIVDNGVASEELAAIFNPWFYRTIAPTSMSIWEQIQFWLTVGIALILIYVAWQITSLDVPTIEQIREAMQAGQSTPIPGGGTATTSG